MVIVSANGSSNASEQVSIEWWARALLSGAARKVDMIQHPSKEVSGLGSEEAFCRRSMVFTLYEEIVGCGQSGHLAVADTMKPVMVKSQVTVATFDAGTGALKVLGTFLGYIFDENQDCGFQVIQWAMKRGQQCLRLLLESVAAVSIFHFLRDQV